MDESGNPETSSQSFEELHLDVMVVRREVEKLAQNALADYSVTLGEIKKVLGNVSHRLGKIEQHPALQMNPALLQEQLAERAKLVMREPLSQFNHAQQSTEHIQQQLASLIGTVSRRRKQLKNILMTSGACLVAGMILSPLALQFLPFGLNTRVAAVIIGADRWQAGAALMAADRPNEWSAYIAAVALWQTNSDALHFCLKIATKLQKTQHCTVNVPVAAPYLNVPPP